MSFLYNITKKTSEVTTKITLQTKLRMKINENKGKIDRVYEEIGKEVYERHRRQEKISIEGKIITNCLNIDKLSKEIEDARKELLKIEHKKMCKKCFAEIETNAKFCSECGERQMEEKTIFEEAEEKLEQTEILPHNKKEAEIVKEELEQKNNN